MELFWELNKNFYRKSLILDSILIWPEPKFLFSLMVFLPKWEREREQKEEEKLCFGENNNLLAIDGTFVDRISTLPLKVYSMRISSAFFISLRPNLFSFLSAYKKNAVCDILFVFFVVFRFADF